MDESIMLFSTGNLTVLTIMILYGLLSGSSAIILKLGIFKAGGIRIKNFVRDLVPNVWRLITTPIWLLGGIAAIVGFLIYTIALNVYDVSVVKPLVNFNLLFTFIFAYIVFKEKLSEIEWFGVGILVIGLLFSAFSPEIESSDEMNIPLLLAFFPLIVLMMVIMVIVMFVLRKGHAEFVFPIFSGSFYGMGTFYTKSLLISIHLLNRNDSLSFFMFIYSFFMLLITYGFAITAQQLAFERGRLSIVSPIANSLSVIVSFLGAYFVFYEDLIVPIGEKIVVQSFFKIIGLFCILTALLILRREIIFLPDSYMVET